MVGYPYASNIDWDSPNWIKSNISNAIYIWDPDASQFATYIGGVGTNGGSQYIASGQAFWVQATAANPVLTATENIKTTNTNGFLKPSNSIVEDIPFMLLKIQKNNHKDEIVVRFMDDASNGFDATLDASKIISSNPNVPAMYSLIDSFVYSINSLSSLDEAIQVPIYTQVTSNGNYTLSLEQFQYFENASCIMLEDQITGQVYNLKNFSQAVVNLNASDAQPRFKLAVYPSLTKTIANASCFGETDGKAVYSTIEANHFSNVFLKNYDQVIVDSITGLVSDTQMIFSSLPAGLYFLNADAENNCPNIRDTFRINEPSAVYADFESIKMAENLTVQFVDYLAGVDLYFWNFGDGNTSNDAQPTHTYDKAGFYPVKLITQNSNGCEDSIEKMVRVSKPTNLELNAIEELASNAINIANQQSKIILTSSNEPIEGTEVLSIDGKLVKAVTGKSAFNIEIDSQVLNRGIYLIKVYTTDNEYIEKIFIP